MNRSIDIGKAITFYTEDEKWLEKLGIGTALVLISTILSVVLVGLVGFLILAGYGVRLLQNVRDGVAKPLPEWDRWGEDLASGFKLVVALFLYTLPALIFMIPVIIGAFIADQGESAQFIGVPFIIGGVCLMIVYSLLVALATPGITIAFARDETIGSALRFNAIWEWTRERIGTVLIVALVNIAVSAVLGLIAPLLGIILCVVGILVTIPLATLLQTLIANHMYGQMAQEGRLASAYAGAQAEAPVPPSQPTWFEESLSENPPPPAPVEPESSISFLPDDPTPGDTTPSELGDIPNRPDDRPNLPQNPT